jgi:hypothetical protein
VSVACAPYTGTAGEVNTSTPAPVETAGHLHGATTSHALSASSDRIATPATARIERS